ncbi:unnamed protein product [Dracunculus medinensis]|uniref:Uncharacterized protein n=1 Tax=Dracunculus medinensis TaxID=318479 RepID=A0A0N4U483_DRAME|nr:unnamed protein product [Dracunculus medinensis]
MGNDRTTYVHFKGKFNISVISVYAPTLSANDCHKDKDKFYAELQLTKSQPKHNMVIIALVSHAAVTMNSVIGKYGIRGSMQQQRTPSLSRHLVAWNSPDNQYSNQIDYILVNHRWKSYVLDSRSYRNW